MKSRWYEEKEQKKFNRNTKIIAMVGGIYFVALLIVAHLLGIVLN